MDIARDSEQERYGKGERERDNKREGARERER